MATAPTSYINPEDLYDGRHAVASLIVTGGGAPIPGVSPEMAAVGPHMGLAGAPGVVGGHWLENVEDGIVAHAGGGQGSAYALTMQTSRVATVATAGDSVLLPAAVIGDELLVINEGANYMQVYGTGADTVDGVASGTGVPQMAGSVVIYVCPTAGKWKTNGLASGYFGPFQTSTGANAVAAVNPGAQNTATPLAAQYSRVTTVPAAGSGVLLPATTGLPLSAALPFTVTNASGANALNVYPAVGDQINALGANAAFSVAATKTCTFIATVAGQWHTLLSA